MKEGEQRSRVPIVGQIVGIHPHSNADRIYIANVDVGNQEVIDIIFGGDRMLELGNLVPVALPGTRLPSGEKIRPRKYRGVRSYGELLSSDELGWTTGGVEEVVVLPSEKFQVGEKVT